MEKNNPKALKGNPKGEEKKANKGKNAPKVPFLSGNKSTLYYSPHDEL